MDTDRLQKLLGFYYSNKINRQECEELLDQLDKADEKASNIVDEFFKGKEDEAVFDDIKSEIVLKRIKSDYRFPASKVKSFNAINSYRKLQWSLIAATLLIVGSFSFWFLSEMPNYISSVKKKTPERLVQNEIKPGSNKAVLTLSAGEVFNLNGIDTGLIAYTGGTRISNEEKGMLLFKSKSEISTSLPSYSKITTPKGGEYKITLPDGTLVWLNSSSSIQFPTAFVGNIRKVQLTGEAYFEVAKNKQKPFQVEASGVIIKVLGTHFNVSSYKNGIVKTSLIEGSVIVEGQNKLVKKLKPGQQAVVLQKKYIEVSDTDVEEAIAWKDGFFKFQDEDIKSIMEEISRWYDIEIEFKDNTGEQRFGGVFSKSKSLAELLSSFETVGNIHFKIEGRRVTVIK